MPREGWQSAIIQYRLYIGMMPLRLRGRFKTSRLVEAARELAIGIVFKLGGDARPLSREEHTLVILANREEFIRHEHSPPTQLPADRYVTCVAVNHDASSSTTHQQQSTCASRAL